MTHGSKTAHNMIADMVGSTNLPLGIQVTVLISGTMISGITMSPKEYAESLKSDLIASLRKTDEGDLIAAFQSVDTAKMQGGEFIYLQSAKMLSVTGVTTKLKTNWRLRKDSIDGVVMGVLADPE